MKSGSTITKKIKAFTLMELAVGMLLTTVTVAAGFSLYLFFIKTIKKHTEDEKLVKDLHAYYFQMESDLENAKEIFPSENGIALITYDDKKIIYRMQDTILLREIPESIPDTFKIKISSFEIPDDKMINGKLTEFSVTHSLNKKDFIWQWKKEYSPVESINHYIQTENEH
jgi:type II secretory pathway component PulJ